MKKECETHIECIECGKEAVKDSLYCEECNKKLRKVTDSGKL